MIHIFRKNQRVMMFVVAVLTIIAFIWLYNPDTKTGNAGPNSVGEIYGRNLTQADIDREIKNYQLALALQQFDLIGDLGGMAENENAALTEFIFNLLVLKHQAKELGVKPTDLQIADRIKTLSVFQTGEQFDPRKYAEFTERQLGPRGLTERQLEEVMSDALRLDRIKNIVGAPMAVSEGELLEAARAFQKVNVQVVRFPLTGVPSAIPVTEEEIQAFYSRYRPNLIAPETRSVAYVEFAPPAGQLPAEGKAKVEALQKLADAATAFAEQAAGSSFEKAAAASGLTVQTTPDIDRTGTVQTGDIKPQSKDNAETLKNLAAAAFLLSEENPLSDALQSGEKFFVVSLAKVSPQRPLTVDEVRPDAEIQIRAMKTERLVQENAAASLAKIRDALGGGKTFADAVTASGLKAESFKDLALSGGTLSPEQSAFAQATFLMEPGQVSGFLPGADGGFAVYLDARAPLDPAELDRQKTEIEPGILAGKKRMLFLSWLASAREAAKISMAPRGR